MPIKVTCSCGAKFAAKDELAGRTVKCPKCEIPLKIPSAQAQPAGPTQQQQAPKPAPTAPKPATAPQPAKADDIFGLAPVEGNRHLVGDPFMNELLAEAGVMSDPNYQGPRCPGCNSPIQQGAVLCVKCGFDLRTGMRVKSEIGPSSEFAHLSHGATAEEAMRKAEREIAETPMESSASDHGDNFTAFLLAGGMVLAALILLPIGFLLFRYIDVTATKMSNIGVLMLIIGLPMTMIGKIWLITVAFMESAVQGILVLLIDCYAMFYGFTHMGNCAIPTVMFLVGGCMCNAAWIMFAMGDSEEGVYLSPPAIERQAEQLDLGRTQPNTDSALASTGSALRFESGSRTIPAPYVYSLPLSARPCASCRDPANWPLLPVPCSRAAPAGEICRAALS